jgi:anti-sigma-K factor RskA
VDQSEHQPEHEMPSDYGKNGQPPSQNQLCESIEMLIPAYSMGAADAEERAFFETNLASCPDAEAELAHYRALNEALLYSAPLAQAPGHLASKLVAAVAERSAQSLSVSGEDKTAPVNARKRLSAPKWQYLVAAAAVILILLLAGLNVYWIVQNDQLRSTQQQILAKLNSQDQVFRIFGAGKAKRVELAAVNTPSTGASPYAALLCDPWGQQGLLYVKNFPKLPADKSYQLWVRGDGHPVSLGVFQVDDDGTATVVFWAPETLNAYQGAGITLEPSGGSPQPTGTAVVRGAIKY